MIRKTAELLRQWDNILILCHASPDGDTLGSAGALMRGLMQLRKKVTFKCGDVVAPKYDYLFEGINIAEFEPDKIVSVDVADINLLGSLKETYGKKVDLAIDHHASHRPFGKTEWIDPACAANAEMIYALLLELGAVIDEKIADCIYTGLSTDTGCFRYRNVTANTHRIAAEVMEKGANAGDINQSMFETKTRAQTEAEIAAMGSIEYFFGGKCALLSVTRKMMEETGIEDADLDALASKPRQIEGVLIGVTLKEREEGGFKASVRTNEPANSSEICAKLGGGGHRGAAGCSISGTLEEAKKKILRACEEYLAENS